MKKQLIFAIIICLVIVLAFVGYYFYYPYYQNYKYQTSLIKVKDPRLTDSERQIYEQRLADNAKGLADAKTDDERYNWLLDKGNSLYGLGRLAEAEQVFQEAVKLKPDKPAGFVSLYTARNDRRDYKGALESIKKASSLSPGSAEIWRKYIQLEIDKFNPTKEFVKALFNESLTKTQVYLSQIDIVTFYASWLGKVGDYSEAIQYWQKAIELNPAEKTLYQGEINQIQAKIQ